MSKAIATFPNFDGYGDLSFHRVSSDRVALVRLDPEGHVLAALHFEVRELEGLAQLVELTTIALRPGPSARAPGPSIIRTPANPGALYAGGDDDGGRDDGSMDWYAEDLARRNEADAAELVRRRRGDA